MCGICGIINFNNLPVSKEPILNMMRIMKHRGPDDEGVFFENNVGLGFVRLSIIDLTPAGHQPMLSDDGRFVLVFNGEIYNYLELREELQKAGVSFHTNTDSEVLLKAYIHWGESCFHRFNGMWACVIYDTVARKVLISRDRYGIKPFYYLNDRNFFAFCSEIPPLLSLLGRKPTPDYQSIFDFLVFNRTDQTQRTFFDEVTKLQHGHLLELDLDEIPESLEPENSLNNRTIEIQPRKWYDLREKVSNSKGFSSPEEFRDLISSAFGLRLRSDVPVGVCLSGGLDSSSIVSILLKDFDKKDLNTF